VFEIQKWIFHHQVVFSPVCSDVQCKIVSFYLVLSELLYSLFSWWFTCTSDHEKTINIHLINSTQSLKCLLLFRYFSFIKSVRTTTWKLEVWNNISSEASLFTWKLNCELGNIAVNLEISLSIWKHDFKCARFKVSSFRVIFPIW